MKQPPIPPWVRDQERGMTLIEMLIVLAILAVAAGAVTLGIGAASRAPNVETEARRLATRLQAAGDDALLGDRMMAFTATGSGYGFAMYRDGQWLPRTDAALGFHTLPGGMVLELSLAPPVLLGIDGQGQTFEAMVESGGERWLVRYDGLTALAERAPAA